MAVFLVLALATTLATQGAPRTPPCPGESTPQINQCFAGRLTRAEANLSRYLTASRERLQREAGAAGDTTAAAAVRREFDAAEHAWSAYREAECGAVYDYWSGGSIRTVESLNCRIGLTRLHTHTIWQLWLTYMDSTPPLLPEPPVSPDD